MAPLVIEVPELAVSAETENPIDGQDRYRVYIGPEIELVLTPTTAEHLVDALVDAMDKGSPLTTPIGRQRPKW